MTLSLRSNDPDVLVRDGFCDPEAALFFHVYESYEINAPSVVAPLASLKRFRLGLDPVITFDAITGQVVWVSMVASGTHRSTIPFDTNVVAAPTSSPTATVSTAVNTFAIKFWSVSSAGSLEGQLSEPTIPLVARVNYVSRWTFPYLTDRGGSSTFAGIDFGCSIANVLDSKDNKVYSINL